MEPRALDMAAYPRRAHFDAFRAMDLPYAGVCADVDVTPLLERIRADGLPTYLTTVYVMTRAANAVPELRRRIRGDGIVEYPHCDSSYTLLLDDGTYCHCHLDFARPFADYIRTAREEQERERRAAGIAPTAGEESYFFVSCLPWVRFTGLQLPMNVRGDSNPRITTGRMFAREGRTFMPTSLIVHHALADGLHISRFFQALEERQLDYLETKEEISAK